MAEVAPFSGLRYDAQQAPDLACWRRRTTSSTMASTAPWRRAITTNVVRLELPRGQGDARYEGAADQLSAWTSQGVLRVDLAPAFYVYEQQFDWNGARLTRRGFFGAVRLEPFERRVVLPHEHTLGPKEDRRRLLRATPTQFSPIFGLYRDGDGTAGKLIDAVAAGPALVETTTPDGIRHRMWLLSHTVPLARLSGLLADKQILIADGHHRYETMLGLRDQLRPPGVAGPAPSDFTMMFLARAEDPDWWCCPPIAW